MWTPSWPHSSASLGSTENYYRMGHSIGDGAAHVCSPQSGCLNMPFQTCASVCGVVCIVLMALAELDKEAYQQLEIPRSQQEVEYFIKHPSTWAHFLRRTAVKWIVKKKIDTTTLSSPTSNNANSSDHTYASHSAHSHSQSSPNTHADSSGDHTYASHSHTSNSPPFSFTSESPNYHY